MGKYKVIGCGLAFLILAAISCWATEKSLHMLLPANWPEILVWGMTVAFFIVASIGTKLIADSLVSRDYVSHRLLKLWGGIALVVCFWLVMSMPTNTHTFYFNDNIAATLSEDIKTTQKYLDRLVVHGSRSSEPVLDEEGKRMKDAVEEQRTHIVAQFNGQEPPYKRGNGKEIGKHLHIINTILNSSIQQSLPYNSQDPAILNGYHMQINRALSHALETHTVSAGTASAAKQQIDRLKALEDSINSGMATRSLSEGEIRQCEKEIREGYNLIKNNRVFIQFDPGTDDEEVYTRPNGATRTGRLFSVTEVFFVDFLHGRLPASFWFYVMLSVLVDVAAFIFFDIMLSKSDD